MGTIEGPALELSADAADLQSAAEAVSRSFVSAPPRFQELVVRDPQISRLDARYPGIRTVLHPDPLAALIRSISAQQVNLRWATEIRRRLGLRYGTEHSIQGETVRSIQPDALAQATIEDLRAVQLTTSKSRSVIAVAQAAAAGDLDFAELAMLDDAAVIERLVKLPGIGPWSADWFLARTLGRPKVAAGDLGVRKAVGRAYLDGRLPSEREARELTAHWGDAANVAQQLVLRDLVDGAGDLPQSA